MLQGRVSAVVSFEHERAGGGVTMDDNERLLTNRRLLLLVIAAALAAMLMLFVADNFVLTEVRFLNRGIQVRLAWAMIVPLILGISIGWLWGRFRR